MQLQFAILESRIMKLSCRCRHIGNCTMRPLSTLYSESVTASSAKMLSTLSSSSLKLLNGKWELFDTLGFHIGSPSLNPAQYDFIREILPLLDKYSATLNDAILLNISEKYLECQCYPKTSGEFCEIIN